jgi:adenylate kinase
MKNLLVVLALACAMMGAQLYGEPSTARGALVVVLLGPPGSGKGTQAAKLCQKLGIPHISTGDIFRENIKEKTALGQKANEYISKGNLVPDEITLDMLFNRVSQADCKEGYLLDGFPRTVTQAEALDKRLSSQVECVVLNLAVSDPVILQRATGRLLCRSCDNIQHRDFSPPKQPGVCDRCGGQLYQRPDDAEAVVRQRLEVYHKQTEPVIAYYRNKGMLREVNGEEAPHQVFEELFAEIMED